MSSNSTETKVYRVSELNELIKYFVESHFENIQVLGELSGVVISSAGHLYCTLKDAAAVIKVVMFRGNLLKNGTEHIRNGLQVVVRGTLSMYQPRGEIQLVALAIQRQGVGDIFAALEKLKKTYQEKGYFDPARKKKLPLLPRTIGLVTSPTGAAVRDILRILHRRFPGINVIINPVKVQGDGAAAEIAAAINYFNQQYPKPVDVLIVGRGGGSYEDLWAFNESVVVEAIFQSRIPIISAVGHEIDFTIADFVADVRAATPSAAAEMVVAKKEEFLQCLALHAGSLEQSLQGCLHQRNNDMMKHMLHPRFQGFPRRLLEQGQRLDNDEFALQQGLLQHNRLKVERLTRSRERFFSMDIGQALQNQRLLLDREETLLDTRFDERRRRTEERMNVMAANLQAVYPANILARGYSITTTADRRLVKDAAVLQSQDLVHIQFQRGRVTARIDGRNEA